VLGGWAPDHSLPATLRMWPLPPERSPVDPESSTASALCQQTHVGGLNTLNLWFTDIGQDLLG
jgi:hypothetical protein